MTPSNRELDAEVARVVFGMRLEPIPTHTETKAFYGCFIDEHIKQMGKAVRYGDKICIGSFPATSLQDRTIEFYAPRFTEDPAAAMSVLKKCWEKHTMVLGKASNGNPSVGTILTLGTELKTVFEEGATIELAICKAALKLHGKEG